MSHSSNKPSESNSRERAVDNDVAPDHIAKPTRKRAPGLKVEWKVLTVMALFVILLEIKARQMAPTIDSAAEHIHEFPHLVNEVQANNSAGESLVILGNSLMRNGLDEELLQSKMLPGVEVTKVTPVGTTIVDWTFLYKRYFENVEIHPDKIVVGFVRHHIADKAHAYPNRNRRLGRHFLAWEDQPLAWETEFPATHDRVQTSLSHYSAMMGDQPEHSLLLMQEIIPNYSSGLSINNDWVNAWKQKRREQAELRNPKKAAVPTYVRLQRFIDLMKAHHVEVSFVPMPQPTFYELDQEIIDIVKSSGMQWLDARKLCLDDAYFSDGYHLGDKGKEKFTHWLSQHLSE